MTVPNTLAKRIRGNDLEHYLTPSEIEAVHCALIRAKLVTAVEKTIVNEDGTTYRAAEIRIIVRLHGE